MATTIIIEFEPYEKSPLETIYEIKKLLEEMKKNDKIEGYTIGLLTDEDVEAEVLEVEVE